MKSGTDINQDKETESTLVCGEEKSVKSYSWEKRREKNFSFFHKLVKQTHWLQILKWMRRSRHKNLFYCNDSTQKREKTFFSYNEKKYETLKSGEKLFVGESSKKVWDDHLRMPEHWHNIDISNLRHFNYHQHHDYWRTQVTPCVTKISTE